MRRREFIALLGGAAAGASDCCDEAACYCDRSVDGELEGEAKENDSSDKRRKMMG